MGKLTENQLFVLEKGSIDCADVEALLGDYVDGELTASLHARVEDHIVNCDHCTEGEEGYRDVILLAKDIGRNPKPMPNEVRLNLKRALNERLGLSLSMAS